MHRTTRPILAASLALLALSASARSMSAAATELTATSRIDAVTVFPSSAEVTRLAKLKIDKGDHTVIFADLPASAIQNSIRVEGKATGALEIGSVDTSSYDLQQADQPSKEQKAIQDEIERLKDERAVIEAQSQAAETQKKLIENLTNLPSRPAPTQGAEKAEDWNQVLAVIASGVAGAAKLAAETQVKLRDADRKIADQQAKLAALQPPVKRLTRVKVFVAAGAPLDAELTVRYQVPNASWQPTYDARLVSGTKSAPPRLTLTRRAGIQQRTGEAWDDVALQLSTTRPSTGTAVPDLRPITVDFEPEAKPVAAPPPMPQAMAPRAGAAAPRMADEDAADRGVMRKAKKAEAPMLEVAQETRASVDNSGFQAVFGVPGRVSVAGTGEAKRVQLQEESIEPALTVRTVPRLDPRAFVYAKLALPKGAPLLAGPISIFRDGTFVGTGRLPQLAPSEEHELGFGADDAVKVKYAVVEEKRGESGLISSAKTDVRSYRISVKNLHERPVALTILDQIPASQNQDIKVELTGKSQPTKRDVEDKRGVMSFESSVAPDEERVIEFGYKVTWPAAKGIVYGR